MARLHELIEHRDGLLGQLAAERAAAAATLAAERARWGHELAAERAQGDALAAQLAAVAHECVVWRRRAVARTWWRPAGWWLVALVVQVTPAPIRAWVGAWFRRQRRRLASRRRRLVAHLAQWGRDARRDVDLLGRGLRAVGRGALAAPGAGVRRVRSGISGALLGLARRLAPPTGGRAG